MSVTNSFRTYFTGPSRSLFSLVFRRNYSSFGVPGNDTSLNQAMLSIMRNTEMLMKQRQVRKLIQRELKEVESDDVVKQMQNELRDVKKVLSEFREQKASEKSPPF